jgi:predicted ATPase
VVTEDQVASLFEDADLEENVMAWTEDVFDVQVRAKPIPPNVTLVTRARRFAPKIVNEGLGLNQATYMFAVLAAAQEGSLTAIEEPEISLHPKAQSRLANIFVEIAKLQKHILITTHSEHILIALLTLVAKGEIPPDFLSIYSFQKTKHTSKPKKLKINEKGQVEGGIKDFFDHELSTSLEYLKALAKGSP